MSLLRSVLVLLLMSLLRLQLQLVNISFLQFPCKLRCFQAVTPLIL